MELYSFDGAKVDLDNQNLGLLRAATKQYALNLKFPPRSKVLEVGPPRQAAANNSPIFQVNPDWYYDLRAVSNGVYAYFDLDLDPKAHPDFVGDLGSPNLNAPVSFFDSIICFSVLEHVPNLNQAVINVFSMLKPGGAAHFITPWDLRFHGPRPDCWRISDDAYDFLLAPYASSVEITKIENPVRPLSPVGLIVRAAKKE